MNVRPYGDDALLVDLVATDPEPHALREVLLGADLDGVGEVVPGARTLLVHVDAARWDPAALRAVLAGPARPVARGTVPADLIELPVRYDGADLADVAAQVGASCDDVAAWHAAPTYTVAFCGFAPGFAYLRGLDPRLHLPRLATPRERVPAGAVGIADEYTGVYPHRSPGGWRLIGHSAAVLWDLDRTPPAVLSPGTQVRFAPT